MGAARLRVSAFPVIDNSPAGLAWVAPPEPFLKITPRQAAAMKKAAAGEQDLDALNPPAKTTPKTSAPKAAPAKSPAAEDRAKTFARWDTNQDGSVTLAEYLAGQKPNDLLEARFKRLDKNGDGKLTLEEFVGPSTK